MPYPYTSFEAWLCDEEALGNVLRISTPLQCGDEAHIVDIGNGIPGKQPQTEMRAVSRYLHSLPGKPIGIIQHPIDNRPDIPVVVNPWPTRERVLRGLGCRDKNELCQKILSIPGRRIKPRVVRRQDAPCKEVIISGDAVDLRRDIPRVWVEFHQCLWSGFNGTAVIADADTGAHSLGKIRVGQYQWQEGDPARPCTEHQVKRCMYAAISRGNTRPTNTASRYLRCRADNKPLPGAFTFCDPTDLQIVAALKTLPWPENGDEYEMLGGFRNEPVEVVPAETIPGLLVPAHSHWVLEGAFLPEDEKLPDCAGDDNFIPYILGGGIYTVFRVDCITRRTQPLWTDCLSSSGGLHGQQGTHTGLAAINLEAEAINYLRGRGFMVKDVVLHAGPFLTVIQLAVDGSDKPFPRYGQEAGRALSQYGVFTAASYIIVVGPDCDPHSASDVLWILAMLAQPRADAFTFIKETPGIDAVLGKNPVNRENSNTTGQMVIDATVPVPERYAGWSLRSDPMLWELEAIERIGKKITLDSAAVSTGNT